MKRQSTPKLSMLSQWMVACGLVAVLGAMQGCSDSGPRMYSISGVATRNSQPIQGLFVTFRPDDPSKTPEGFGSTDSQGRFTIQVGSKKGVFPGSYTVMIGDPAAIQGGNSNDPIVKAVMEKYGRNSPLKVTVEMDDDDFELKLD
jgi:hypothetical protein